ncbi:MAG: hypothetical protein CO095_11415 [Armatimonadetes bacterium CG_4_9_14_3_um_filter_58_7]|nr:MAG: hypothetical protein CO095_11415 [Armatimonadetes bacterium CG_4_9_14_3_um_filter_58_7]
MLNRDDSSVLLNVNGDIVIEVPLIIHIASSGLIREVNYVCHGGHKPRRRRTMNHVAGDALRVEDARDAPPNHHSASIASHLSRLRCDAGNSLRGGITACPSNKKHQSKQRRQGDANDALGLLPNRHLGSSRSNSHHRGLKDCDNSVRRLNSEGTWQCARGRVSRFHAGDKNLPDTPGDQLLLIRHPLVTRDRHAHANDNPVAGADVDGDFAFVVQNLNNALREPRRLHGLDGAVGSLRQRFVQQYSRIHLPEFFPGITDGTRAVDRFPGYNIRLRNSDLHFRPRGFCGDVRRIHLPGDHTVGLQLIGNLHLGKGVQRK